MYLISFLILLIFLNLCLPCRCSDIMVRVKANRVFTLEGATANKAGYLRIYLSNNCLGTQLTAESIKPLFPATKKVSLVPCVLGRWMTRSNYVMNKFMVISQRRWVDRGVQIHIFPVRLPLVCNSSIILRSVNWGKVINTTIPLYLAWNQCSASLGRSPVMLQRLRCPNGKTHFRFDPALALGE